MAKTRSQIQLMYGRLVDWESVNPILASGEVACVFDNSTLTPIDLRFGNGILTFSQLPSLSDIAIGDNIYTKTQVDALLTSISALVDANKTSLTEITTVTIPAITELIDENAADDNKLTSLSTVANSIEAAIVARLGRLIRANSLGDNFDDIGSLLGGPWYYQGEKTTPVEGDVAIITGATNTYKYTTTWEEDITSVEYTEAERAALDSGITAALVSTYESRLSILETGLSNLSGELSSNVAALRTEVAEDIEDKANKITTFYAHTPYIASRGSGYTVYTEVTVGDLKGVITSVNSAGGITGLHLFDSTADATTDVAISIIADGSSSATCTIGSTLKTYDLSDTDSYLKQLIEDISNARISKSTADGTFKLIKDNELTSLYSSSTIKYVDKAFTGTSDGSELAPYTTGTEALADIGSTDECTIIYSTGDYEEDLALRYIENKNFIGYAVGSANNTSLQGIRIYSTSSSIGLRDLTVYDALEISATDVYCDNLTVNCSSTLSTEGTIYFTHCNFNYNVQVSSGTIEFDSCTFSSSSKLTITGDAKVIVRNGINVTPTVGSGSTYIQLSGSIAPLSSGTYALTASGDASFVGLFNGVAVSSSNIYAPISIATGPKYALGLFLFDENNSIIPDSTYRISQDGLSGNQVLVSAKEAATDGYTTDSIYLVDHLDAISNKLYELSVASATSSSGIDEIKLEAGSTNGTLVVSIYFEGTQIATSGEVAVKGLGSAAYTDATAYATAAQGALAATAYQKPSSGIPSSDLESTLQTTLDNAEVTTNKVTSVTSAGTSTQYPAASAVYSYGQNLLTQAKSYTDTEVTSVADSLTATNSAISTLNTTVSKINSDYITSSDLSSAIADAVTGASVICADASGSAFSSLSALQSATTYYNESGSVVSTLSTGCTAYYYSGSELYSAVYISGEWEALGGSVSFTSTQLAALNSGVTSDIVSALGDVSGLGSTVVANISSLTSSVKTNTSSISTLSDSLSAAEASVSELDTDVTSLSTRVDKVESTASTLDSSKLDKTAITAGTSGAIMTHSGAAGTLGSSRAVDSSISTSTTSGFSASAASATTNIPTTDAVVSALNSLATWTTNQIANASSGGTIDLSGYLTTETLTSGTGLVYSNGSTLSYKTITSSVSATDTTSTNIPTAGAVGSALSTINTTLAGKQAAITTGTAEYIVKYNSSGSIDGGGYKFDTSSALSSLSSANDVVVPASTIYAGYKTLTDSLDTLNDTVTDLQTACDEKIAYPSVTDGTYGLTYSSSSKSWSWNSISSSTQFFSSQEFDVEVLLAGNSSSGQIGYEGDGGEVAGTTLYVRSNLTYLIGSLAGTNDSKQTVASTYYFAPDTSITTLQDPVDTSRVTLRVDTSTGLVSNFHIYGPYVTSTTSVSLANKFSVPCYSIGLPSTCALTFVNCTIPLATSELATTAVSGSTAPSYTYTFKNSTVYLRVDAASKHTFKFYNCKVYIYTSASTSTLSSTTNALIFAAYDSDVVIFSCSASRTPALMTMSGATATSHIYYYAQLSDSTGIMSKSISDWDVPQTYLIRGVAGDTTTVLYTDGSTHTYEVSSDGVLTSTNTSTKLTSATISDIDAETLSVSGETILSGKVTTGSNFNIINVNGKLIVDIDDGDITT